MARRRSAQKREILPDPKYHDKLVTTFINNLMLDGKKSLAEKIFYNSMDLIQAKESEDALALFKKAVENDGINPLDHLWFILYFNEK